MWMCIIIALGTSHLHTNCVCGFSLWHFIFGLHKFMSFVYFVGARQYSLTLLHLTIHLHCVSAVYQIQLWLWLRYPFHFSLYLEPIKLSTQMKYILHSIHPIQSNPIRFDLIYSSTSSPQIFNQKCNVWNQITTSATDNKRLHIIFRKSIPLGKPTCNCTLVHSEWWKKGKCMLFIWKCHRHKGKTDIRMDILWYWKYRTDFASRWMDDRHGFVMCIFVSIVGWMHSSRASTFHFKLLSDCHSVNVISSRCLFFMKWKMKYAKM